MKARSVLVVDDNDANLELARCLLEAAGLRVACAIDAEAAREQLRHALPDLVLMDIQMPGTDGLTLTREIRATPRLRSLCVVAFTAQTHPGDQARFREAGCDGCLVKPIDVRQFGRQVIALIDDLECAFRDTRRIGENP